MQPLRSEQSRRSAVTSRALALVFTATAVHAAACEDGDRFCYPGDYRHCACADPSIAGYQQCDTNGEAYGACDCSGNTPGLAPAAGGSGSGGGGTGGSGGAELLPFTSPCDTDEQCESGNCFPFNAKGPHCTMDCDGPEDCPPPSDGCSMMGVCKVP